MTAKRVLLVEDDLEIGELLTIAIETAGFDIELVRTEVEALRRIETRTYDLVISDWRLPRGGDGMTIVGRAADRGVKTIVISGYPIDDADKRHEYLMKPIRLADMAVAVERIIGPTATSS